MASARWLGDFVVRRSGEVRRHLAAVLIAAGLAGGVVWFIGIPVLSQATSAQAVIDGTHLAGAALSGAGSPA